MGMRADQGGRARLRQRGWLPFSAAARWTADDFCSCKYSAGQGRKWRWREVKAEGKSDGGRKREESEK